MARTLTTLRFSVTDETGYTTPTITASAPITLDEQVRNLVRAYLDLPMDYPLTVQNVGCCGSYSGGYRVSHAGFILCYVDQPDMWVTACGGKEDWTRYASGREFLYVWNPRTGKHAWLGRDDVAYSNYETLEIAQ